MKFIVFSDLHIHNYKKFDKDGSRLRNCIKVLEDIFEKAYQKKIPYILFAGDLFDQQKSLPISVINETVRAFKRLSELYPDISFIAISGNHDHGSKNTSEKSAETSLEFLDLMLDNFHLIDRGYFDLSEDYRVWGIPYYSHAEHYKNMVSSIDPSEALNNYLLIHQTPLHSNSMIPHDCSPNDSRDFDFTFCGHIHKYERLSEKFCIVGSPLHRDLGDEGQDKGFLIFDTIKNDYERVILDFPKIVRTNDETTDYAIPIVHTMPETADNHTSLDLNSSPESLLKEYLAIVEKDDYFTTGKTLLHEKL